MRDDDQEARDAWNAVLRELGLLEGPPAKEAAFDYIPPGHQGVMLANPVWWEECPACAEMWDHGYGESRNGRAGLACDFCNHLGAYDDEGPGKMIPGNGPHAAHLGCMPAHWFEGPNKHLDPEMVLKKAWASAIMRAEHRPYRCEGCGAVKPMVTNHEQPVLDNCQECSWRDVRVKGQHFNPGWRQWTFAGEPGQTWYGPGDEPVPENVSPLLKPALRPYRESNILDPIQKGLDSAVFDKAGTSHPELKPAIAAWVTARIWNALEESGYGAIALRLVLTGSLTTYQWSAASDFDVSLWVDPDSLPEGVRRSDLIRCMIDKVDGTMVPGTTHPMQDFVVDWDDVTAYSQLYRKGLRSAYDLGTQEWIVPPERDRAVDAASLYPDAFHKAQLVADKLKEMLADHPKHLKKMWDLIHARRHADMAAGLGDFAESNLIYKFIANLGLFPDIAKATGEYLASVHEHTRPELGHPMAVEHPELEGIRCPNPLCQGRYVNVWHLGGDEPHLHSVDRPSMGAVPAPTNSNDIVPHATCRACSTSWRVEPRYASASPHLNVELQAVGDESDDAFYRSRAIQGTWPEGETTTHAVDVVGRRVCDHEVLYNQGPFSQGGGPRERWGIECPGCKAELASGKWVWRPGFGFVRAEHLADVRDYLNPDMEGHSRDEAHEHLDWPGGWPKSPCCGAPLRIAHVRGADPHGHEEGQSFPLLPNAVSAIRRTMGEPPEIGICPMCALAHRPARYAHEREDYEEGPEGDEEFKEDEDSTYYNPTQREYGGEGHNEPCEDSETCGHETHCAVCDGHHHTEDEHEDVPEDWDAFVGQDRHGWYGPSPWTASVEGKPIEGKAHTEEGALHLVHHEMDRTGYYPNVWVDNGSYQDQAPKESWDHEAKWFDIGRKDEHGKEMYDPTPPPEQVRPDPKGRDELLAHIREHTGTHGPSGTSKYLKPDVRPRKEDFLEDEYDDMDEPELRDEHEELHANDIYTGCPYGESNCLYREDVDRDDLWENEDERPDHFHESHVRDALASIAKEKLKRKVERYLRKPKAGHALCQACVDGDHWACERGPCGCYCHTSPVPAPEHVPHSLEPVHAMAGYRYQVRPRPEVEHKPTTPDGDPIEPHGLWDRQQRCWVDKWGTPDDSYWCTNRGVAEYRRSDLNSMDRATYMRKHVAPYVREELEPHSKWSIVRERNVRCPDCGEKHDPSDACAEVKQQMLPLWSPGPGQVEERDRDALPGPGQQREGAR